MTTTPTAMTPTKTLILLLVVLALSGCARLRNLPGGPLGGPPGMPVPAGDAPDPRPVVVTGAELDPLLGVAPDDVVAFVFERGQWRQIAVQVDERFVYDPAVGYRGLDLRRDPTGAMRALGYADPGTLVGSDPNRDLDADDEVALLLADFGAEGVGHPEGVVARTGTEVAATAGGATRYAYLYRRATPRLDPAAGADLVRYDPSFRRGSYRQAYDREGRSPPRRPRLVRDPYVSNPENTTVRTPYYALGFSDRWILNELRIENGPDILDVDVMGSPIGNCARSPYTASLGRGAFLVNRDGPVRGIRRVIGFNSGSLTEVEWVFYPRLAEARLTLRVHPLPGPAVYIDHSAAAQGMRLRTSTSNWVEIDGRPDRLGGAAPAWAMVTGRQGSYVVDYRVESSGLRLPPVVGVYEDDARPRATPCLLDGSFYGAHGLRLGGEIANTDPSRGRAGDLRIRRRFAFGGNPEASLRALQEEVRVRARPVRGGA